MANPLRLTKDATPANLTLFLTLVDVLADRHGLLDDARGDLRLLTEEACTNVVMHAFPGREPGELTLELDYADGVASVTLIDDGVAFSPSDAPRPDLGADWQSRREGGVGWHLIRTLSDELEYERVDERNRLTLRKRVATA
jgi:serine/threonine-protein kinase RsbW